MARQTRRTFLQTALGAAGASFTIAGTKSSGRVIGANDRVRVAVAGIHGRGQSHIAGFGGLSDCEITYLADPDSRLFESRADSVRKKTGTAPRTVQDVRQALDDPNVDVVSIATPNHWHALLTIWACQAGKDVYVEKPCSHNVHEGRIAVEVARKHQRIVQHGTQSRSSESMAGMIAFIHSGQAGKLLVSRGLCYKPRKSIGVKSPETPPSELDFNLWLGPAPQQPFHANLVHYNWHWFWDTGNGDIGNQGVHQMDIARWAIQGATLPRSVLSLGGRFGYEDQGQTANTQLTFFDFGQTQLIFEVRGLATGDYLGQKIGNVFHCEGGIVAGNKFLPSDGGEAVKIPSAPVGPGNGAFGNFIAAVRSRKPQDLNADILEGHFSSALGHLANVSYRLGQPVPFSASTKAFGDNKDAYEALARMEEHLAKGNGLKLDGLQYRLGRKLHIDAQGETILDDAEAKALLTREYRAPFVVPRSV